jgi:hypothetical protein
MGGGKVAPGHKLLQRGVNALTPAHQENHKFPYFPRKFTRASIFSVPSARFFSERDAGEEREGHR